MSNFKNLSDTEYRIALKDFPTHFLLEELERRTIVLDKKAVKLLEEKESIIKNDSLNKLKNWVEVNEMS